MERRSKMIAAGGIAALALAAGTGIAVAGGDDDDDGDEVDTPISEADLDRASTAALAHTGGGEVSDTEVGDEESYYEVEVTLDDGTQVDVQLDEDFNVVGDETDGPGDEDD